MLVEILISIETYSERLSIDDAFRLGGSNMFSPQHMAQSNSFKLTSATHYEKKCLIKHSTTSD